MKLHLMFHRTWSEGETLEGGGKMNASRCPVVFLVSRPKEIQDDLVDVHGSGKAAANGNRRLTAVAIRTGDAVRKRVWRR